LEEVGVVLPDEDVQFYSIDRLHSFVQIPELDDGHVDCRILHETDEVFSHFLHDPLYELALRPLAITLNHPAVRCTRGTGVTHLFPATPQARYLLKFERVAVPSEEIQLFLSAIDHIGETKAWRVRLQPH
jgi:hypothetical protein